MTERARAGHRELAAQAGDVRVAERYGDGPHERVARLGELWVRYVSPLETSRRDEVQCAHAALLD
jgi:hypothetical protein